MAQAGPRPDPTATIDGAPGGEILERASAFFESCVWETETGARIRSRLSAAGIEARTLRQFGVGYAPGDTRELVDHLAEWDYSREELIAAGIASRSDRDYLHILFHARIMFPIRDAEGEVTGFAGLATHLGPSWPLWLTSPTSRHFDTGSAIFGLERAAEAIERSGRALVLRDCVQVLALHQQGRRDAVGVIHSPITREHLGQLSAVLGGAQVHLARRDGRLGVVAAPAGADVDEDAFAEPTTTAGYALIDPKRAGGRAAVARIRSVSSLGPEPPAPARALVYVASALVGVGIPLAILFIAEPFNEAAEGSTPTLNIVIVGVVAAYAVLAFVVARRSARVRARSRKRRMREPWARGSGEWQPAGWTYHRLEEILVGAALLSALTCVVLWMTIGGFLG